MFDGDVADLSYADLSYADLRNADLRYAVLRNADLRYANLRNADLRYANLRYADLSYADLRNANLQGADLHIANLQGAKYSHNGIEAKAFNVFLNLYRYTVIPMISEDGTQHIAMGCHFRTRKEWEEDFWNNKPEFSDDGSLKTAKRKFALATACAWLDMMQKEVEK